MKQISLILAVIAMGVFFSCNQTEKKQVTLLTEVDSLSYALGVDIGSNLSQNMQNSGIDTLNASYIADALQKSYDGGELLMDGQTAAAYIEAYFKRVQESQRQEDLKQYQDNISEGQEFLKENATKEGVVVLPSGLQYKIINKGNGEKPEATDIVTTHYHGTLIDGTVFDSSVDRGEPAQFPVNRVIPGWTEALQLMPVGSKWMLYIPYNLAYGDRGSGKIEPYSTLIFEVELLSIDDQPSR
ncbi:MAG: peptidylprolyl isomerase [Marinilabiliales bacterium]|nr:MAG: peptidylprolyl isomerase [Marinilabiliales bacterium]